MAKNILLSYKAEMFQALNSNGMTFVHDIQRITWFGLVKKIVKHRVTIPDTANFKATIAKWDSLIGKEIK